MGVAARFIALGAGWGKTRINFLKCIIAQLLTFARLLADNELIHPSIPPPLTNQRKNANILQAISIRDHKYSYGATSMPTRPQHYRHSIRPQDYDYRQPGFYYVTICTRDKKLMFGEIANGEIYLNEAGSIVQAVWSSMPERFP